MESSGTGSVIEPLLALEKSGATGVLELTAHGVTTRVYFRAGEIVFADGGTLGETLGRVLIRSGRLTEEHVAAVIRRMTDALVDGQRVRFGEVLVEYGFMTADELELALTQQVKEKIAGCIHRGTSAWRFAKNDPRVDEVGSYVVRTRPLLVEAAARLPERRLETVLALGENRYPEIVAPEDVIAEEFELSKDEAAVLRDLDGTSSLHFIFSKSASMDVMPLVGALVLGGGVELRTTPTGARQSSRAVPPGFRTSRSARADQTEITVRAPVQAIAEASRMGREPTHSSPTLAVAQPVAPPRRPTRERLGPADDDALERARKAFERLKSELDSRKAGRRKRWPDPRNDEERRLMAESAFHQGRLHLRAEEAERALPGLHRAVELCPEVREYELYVKWAQMLVNDWFKVDERRRELQTLAAAVVRENRDCELGLSILGHCAMHDGKDEAALRFFRRAAELDPKLVDASRLAQLLAARAGNKPRRPSSKIDLAARRNERGGLDTPLDELVPLLYLPPDPASKSPRDTTGGRKTSTTGLTAATPYGGLRVEPRVGSTPDETWEGAPAPPAIPTPDGEVTAAVPKPPPLPPAAPCPAEPAPPMVTAALPRAPSAPMPPPASGPHEPPPAPGVPAPGVPAPAVPAPAVHGPPSWQPPAGPPVVPGAFGTEVPPAAPAFAMAMGSDEALRPRRRRVIAIVGAWVVSLAATAAIFYFLGSRDEESSDDGAASTLSTATASSAEAPVPSETTSAEPPPPPTEAPPATASAPPASASVASAPSQAASGKPPTTGILKTKAWGRRVYIDGRIVGEGGRPLTVPCGTRRVKIGSTGKTRVMNIPCGGTLQVD